MRGLSALVVTAALFSCRPASVVPEPEPGSNIPTPPGKEETTSIAFLKTLYNGAPTRVEGEYWISGAVVSSDVQGNFHKTLVLDDGTGGIEVKLDMERMFERFLYHSRVSVRCNGLWLGSYGGTLQLGAEPWDDYQTEPLSPMQIAEHLFADEAFYGEVLPRTLRFSGLSLRDVSTFVAFENVRFAAEERGMLWADIEDESATDRHLVDAAGDTLLVRTSRFADFAGWPLPEGEGYARGVLGYFDGRYQLVLSHYRDFITGKN
jgi:hypothetical protein